MNSSSRTGVLAAMCLSLALVVASVSALNLALPDLAVGLGATNTELTWIADGYTVALAALVLPLSALGDRFGRRTLLLVGTAVFGVASALASQADTPLHLIESRVAMGAGAAMIMPGTLATITAVFPAAERARGVAVWSGFASAGAILGMLGAGALLEAFSWRSIFVASTVLSVLAAIAALTLAPNTKESELGKLDHVGAWLSTLAVGALVFGIIEGSDRGYGSPRALAAFIATLLGFLAYVSFGLRAHRPLLDPRLFGLPGFRMGALTITVQFAAVFGFFFVGLQYLQLILGWTALQAALGLLPVAAVVLVISRLSPWFVTHLGRKLVMPIGLLALATGLLVVSTVGTDSGYGPFLAGILICGFGIAWSGAPATESIVGALSLDKQGVASAVNDTSREVGSALGIAIMGASYSSAYGHSVNKVLPGLSPHAASAVKGSAAGGLAVAERAGAQGFALAHQVRLAFLDGLSSSLHLIAAVLVVAAIVVATRTPR